MNNVKHSNKKHSYQTHLFFFLAHSFQCLNTENCFSNTLTKQTFILQKKKKKKHTHTRALLWPRKFTDCNTLTLILGTVYSKQASEFYVFQFLIIPQPRSTYLTQLLKLFGNLKQLMSHDIKLV